ncbi:hypothetical protein ACIPPJ_30110 [Streptomyces sp. NPDC086091]|uniref:hypothetical protein n=1 Tax=Streptomyces sp. NPDC086091 TaxID=3365751 RepID=UPI00381EE1A8
MPKKKQKKRPQRGGVQVRQRPVVPEPRLSAPAEVARQADDPVWDLEPASDVSSGGTPVDLRLPHGTMPAVRFTFGDLFAQERRGPIREGWGYSMELPAVLELLQQIGDGHLTAPAARGVLLKSADMLYGPLRCWEAEDADALRAACLASGGCVLCEERRTWFDGLLDEADVQWKRWQQPENYPFAAGQQGIHETSCSVVRRMMPTEYARPTGEAYGKALNSFSHAEDHHYGGAFEDSGDYPRLDVMTPDEARSWVAERTGPKGGRNYKLCRRCAPAV